MTEPPADNNRNRRVSIGWLEGHTPASVPYIIGFSIFIPLLLAVNIGLEFWLDRSDPWLTNLRDGLLNAGVMATWGIPLTIIATEGITRMWARDYIARKEQEAVARIFQEVEDKMASQFRQEMAEWLPRIRREVEEELTPQIRRQVKAELEASNDLSTRREELALRREELAVRQAALSVWYGEQIVRWEERKERAAAAGQEFTEPRPEPPPGIHHNEPHSKETEG